MHLALDKELKNSNLRERPLGLAKELIIIPDDFDRPLDDFAEYR